MSQRLTPNLDDSDEDEKTDQDNGIIEKRGKQKKGSLLFGGCSYSKAKKVVVSPFNKFQKLYKKHERSSSSSSNSLRIPVISSSISSITRSGNYCSCLCMSKPRTLGMDYEGIDPNDSNVSCEYIKSLIENNDFYSRECNTHFSD